ncbi:MAG TPA: hypothetical protein VLG15_08525 [Thermoanaerobaculia bacterium]|nr:hypothetical protein [Thermoanaerobaculia bacterium]
MRIARLGGACLLGLVCLVVPELASAGGVVELLGASSDLGNGLFGVVNPSTGAFTQRGTTPTGQQMPALACNASQALFGSENRIVSAPLTPVPGGSRCGFLVGLNPSTGAVTQSFGFITLSGAPNSCLRISDFDFNPANGVLYGVGTANSTRDGLFTISLTTPPVATLVGLLDPSCTTNCIERGGLAFRDDGALFLASVNGDLARLNPADASIVGSILPNVTNCAEAATFRNSDDVMFVDECDGDTLSTVDENTGQATLLTSDPGESLASLAFCGDRGGVVGGVTPTPTVPGPTTTPTATLTSTPSTGVPAAVPTMSGLTLVIFGTLLAAGALLSIFRVRS